MIGNHTQPVLTIAELEQFLKGYKGKHFIPITKDPVFEQRRSDIEAVKAHFTERWEWATQFAELERAPLESQLRAVEGEQADALNRIKSMYSDLGINT